MFNPKALNPIDFYRSFTPNSIGKITIALPATISDGYTESMPSQSLVVQTECSLARIDDRNPGFDRSTPGSIDKAIYKVQVTSTEDTRKIRSGMYARIDRQDGSEITGVIDIVEIKSYGSIRLYIDASQHSPIDWASLNLQPPPSPSPVTGSMQSIGSPVYSSGYIAAIDIEPLRFLYLDSSQMLRYADYNDVSTAFNVIGLSFNSIAAGSIGQVITRGEYTYPSWNWQTNAPIFLGANGMLTQVPPSSGFILTGANATSMSTIDIRIQEPVFLD